MTKGSDLLVAALENEGVERIFGVPGEENLDVVESLRTSAIELVLTRHEQAAAFMAATHGRLTGRPGVCIATLGPGALNFSTGAAYAHLGAMPMIMITGQKAIMTSRQARFQIVDMVARWAADQDGAPDRQRRHHPDHRARRVPRRAGGAAGAGAPGTAGGHRRRGRRGLPLVPPHPIELPVAPPAALDRAAEMILAAERPLVMLGRGRQPAAPDRRAAGFVPPHPAFRSSTPRWARARSPAAPSSTWAPPRCRSATTCTRRSTAPT